ncbi:MAG: hypothetical protein M1387_09620 [Thaumarchaeota archaeon]|nr:hypothetical protein [Nitrososphaerota archaeon]
MNLHRAGTALALLFLILGPTVPLPSLVGGAAAVDIYTSLTYQYNTDFTYEYVTSYNGGEFATRQVEKVQISFPFTLDKHPYAGSDDISGSAIAQGKLTGSFNNGGHPSSGCANEYYLEATFTIQVSAETLFQANKLRIRGASVSNIVENASPPLIGGRCKKWVVSDTLISDAVANGLYGYYVKGAYEFPIQGGSKGVTKGSGNTAPTSVSGTTQLTLVDSKKKESFDFSILVLPPEQKIQGGETATYLVSVSTVKGQAAPVTLTTPQIAGLSSVTLDKVTGTPPFNTTLRLTAGRLSGKYAFQVEGTAGDLRRFSNNATLTVEGCPEFTIRPTMPPEKDPRGFAKPDQDSAAFRFNIFWGGALPVQATFQTNAGGGGTITPKFVFNPATLTTKLTNVIMEATTKLTPKGTYPITVNATVRVPDSGLTCTASTQVSLVVGNSITDFRLEARAGQVQVATVNATPAGGPAVVVKTGDNGSATLTSKAAATSALDNSTATTTVNVGKNSEVRKYSNVINIADEIDDEIIQNDLKEQARLREQRPGLIVLATEAAWRGVEKIGPKVVTSIKQQLKLDLTSKALKALGCALAPSGTNNQEQCSGIDIYITNGRIHVYRTHSPMTAQKGWDIILHDYHIVVPLGTDLIMDSQAYGNSSLTVIDGSVVVVNLISGETQVVNASQRLDMTISVLGNSTSTKDYISNINQDYVPQWWESRLTFPVTVGAKQYAIGMRTNSTVKNLLASKENKTISFTVSGATGTKGYINTTWPKSLLNGTTIEVTMDGKQIPFTLKETNGNYSVYASYSHSQHAILISVFTASTTSTTSSITTTTISTSKSSISETTTATVTTTSTSSSSTTSTASSRSTTISSSVTTSSSVTASTQSSSTTITTATTTSQVSSNTGLPSEIIYVAVGVVTVIAIIAVAFVMRKK